MKKLLFYNLGIVLFYLLIVYIFNGHRIIFPIFTISIFFLSMFLTKKETIYSFGLIFILWIVHLFLPNTKISIVFIYLFFIPLTFWLGFFLKDKSWSYKIIYPILLVFVGLYGFSNLWYFIYNFNAKERIDSPRMVFYDDENTEIRLDTVKNKIIVLDFWTTNCGNCFKKFPDYEKIYFNYKNNPKVNMYVLNIPTIKDTTGHAKKMIDKYNYQFNKLYADSDSIPKEFKFNGYPHLIIIKNGEVRFNGTPNTDKKLFIKDIRAEIEILLNEDV